MMYFRILLLLMVSSIGQVQALGTPDLLPAEKAFQLTGKVISNETIQLSWDIADQYYLYRDKTKVSAISQGIRLAQPEMPKGESKHDEFFGEMVVYHNQLTVNVPYKNLQSLTSAEILVNYQGCAESGVCYPPQKKTLKLSMLAKTPSASNVLGNFLDNFKNSFVGNELLPAEQAFQFSALVIGENQIQARWTIAPGYYLYREKIQLELIDTEHVQLVSFSLPQGEPYHDESFGAVHIFHDELVIDLPLLRAKKDSQSIALMAKFQGCAERGVCYPPMESIETLLLPEAELVSKVNNSLSEKATKSEQDQILQSLKSDSFALTLLSFFGFGLLLAFTPCIFPMIPILSGIIVGQGESVTTRKAFLLSLSYVLASALAYTIFGILAALFGSNLQTAFQQPWVIVLFSSMFILLSFSMFGFYSLELPKPIQARLHNSSDKHRDGSYIGAAIMGALSSLIVGPCVAAPLAGALIYIGQTGDVVLGGSALFVMGFGMGVPLLLLGASAGKILPKAGHWLNSTKSIFGVVMLAVAVWMLDRILPSSLIMIMAAALLIIPAIYMGAVDSLADNSSGWQKLWKGVGLMMLIYGVLILIGLSMGSSHLLKPLQGYAGTNKSQPQGLNFKTIGSLNELDQVLETAQANQQWVMLDFYADWCVSCKEMEVYTFTDQQVKNKLSSVILVQADVTENNVDDKALLKQFELIGPPAILFFAPDKEERKSARVIGYQDSETFLSGLNRLF